MDCTAKIIERWNEGDSIWMRMHVDDEYIKYIVPKGFVAIDGTSLTVCEVNIAQSQRLIQESDEKDTDFIGDNWFTVMLVPHTQQHVIFPMKDVGDLVNIEVDVLGKMVERSLQNNLHQFEEKLKKLEGDLHAKDLQIHALTLKLHHFEDLQKRIENLEANNGKWDPFLQ